VACPLFVPFAEEGLTRHAALTILAEEYLRPLREARVDVVILGCTHYPILAGAIQDALGDNVRLIDSGREAARDVASLLREDHLAREGGDEPRHRYYVSDLRLSFQKVGETFLGRSLGEVTVIEQTDLPWYERNDPATVTRASANATTGAVPTIL
jgi:glutamate racemase